MRTLEEDLSRMEEAARNKAKATSEFLASLPVSSPCQRHPDKPRQRDDRESCFQRRPVFLPCEACAEEQRQEQEVERLKRMGVPLNLCNATFDNWTATDEIAEANLAKAREFTRVHRGFLVLLGDLGTGKSHLAVAVLRSFRTGLFVKQSELLRRLRQTYRDRAAIDPVEAAQSTSCLVLDEIGVSPGGRDELPLLHDVLDYRHGNMKATVMTGNITLNGLQDVIGERMADRLRESAFAVLQFGGRSFRREARAHYFGDE